MNIKEIVKLLKVFSEENNFNYKEKPAPYRPYGEIVGKISETDFILHIYQPEGRISAPISTVFSLPKPNFIPRGFCIEHGYPVGGSLFGMTTNRTFDKTKSFDDQIAILSYDNDIVRKFLNNEIKLFLMNMFEQINRTESSLFGARSCLRISDRELTLTIGKVFENIDLLKKVYIEVSEILLSIKYKLDTKSKN